MKDLEIDTEEDEQEEEKLKAKEGREEVESDKPRSPEQCKPQPVMKMFDISQVKLRETKPVTENRPKTEGEKKVVPSWMEELTKKHARRSAGVFQDQESRVRPMVPPKSPIISKYFSKTNLFFLIQN